MLEPVGPVPRGLEGEQRVQEVRDAETVGGPAAQVDGERAVVGGVVREERGQLLDGADHPVEDLLDGGRRGGALGLEVDGPVLGLPGADLLDGILEHGPGRVLDHPLGRSYRAFGGVVHKNFRHNTSSTENLA